MFAVYVSITTTDTTGTPQEEAPIVGEEMDGWLRGLEGYRGLMLLAAPGVTLGLAFWESEEAASRHAELRAEFRERMLTIAGATIERVDGYDVTYSRVEEL
jgi:hypothetical protein